jgi:AcrR family transcriptional regulator
LIGYHFGGKRGLYVAVFESIAEGMMARVGPAAERFEGLLTEASPGPDRRDLLLGGLFALLDRFIETFAAPETGAWASLIVREQQNPSEAFDLLWVRAMSRVIDLFGRFVGALTGKPTASQDVRLLVLGIIGQILVFRVARTTSLRYLGWSEFGAEELVAVKRRVRQNILLMLPPEEMP